MLLSQVLVNGSSFGVCVDVLVPDQVCVLDMIGITVDMHIADVVVSMVEIVDEIGAKRWGMSVNGGKIDEIWVHL